ncbi:MAG TPA: DNA polymerase III subunit gamma/tau [Thermomonas sp.]|nr:DNA polymerase III subunit gamma/tau [Thermomonas sp.]HQW59220.1 DNA polymerase III subunit gamma/tau [Thermomonas sp.]
MSYLVLARKWRPRRFAELVGQEHVVRALTNALETGRVHHAFLFTGTRGVGKTTIARIFAKSLNCERGTSAEPCGECETCLAIDAGRYIDLLEIDAASNTGVDNVRELIENAQYMPSRGKFKVYLIDEVHMLSKPAFNALLKTLEEPPGHVKFLFATTDPEKLLVTVLSRCLQFNLKRLDEAQIRGQIVKILGAEAIEADDAAVRQLAHAADGSLRDGLSLLDQAIAYTGGRLDADAVAAMLGTVDRNRVNALLCALADGDGARLLAEAAQLAEFSPDWGSVLDALAEALHRIQVKQLVPAVDIAGDGVDVDALAARLRPELVQLWYQMALHGRRDLGYAPSPRSGFEMSLLRMLAFRPGEATVQASLPRAVATAGAAVTAAGAPAAPRGHAATAAAEQARAAVAAAVAPQKPAPPPQSAPPPMQWAEPSAPSPPPAQAVAAASAMLVTDSEHWLELVARSSLRGPARLLAEHAAFVSHADGVLRLSLAAGDEHLQSPSLLLQLGDGLASMLGGPVQLRFETGDARGDTARVRNARDREQKQAGAEQGFAADPDIQRLVQLHGAQIVPDSVRPPGEG